MSDIAEDRNPEAVTVDEISQLFADLAGKVLALGGDPERLDAFTSHLATAEMHATELSQSASQKESL